MDPQIVIAMYKPHDGKDAELRALIDEHIPTLRRLALITDRPSLLARARDGTYLEVFEWRAWSDEIHAHPEVARIWGAMGRVADFVTLSSLEEAGQTFPHFAAVSSRV